MGGPRAWALLCLGLLLPGGSAAWSVGGAPFSARRNWCSYVVTRAVSCHVQNGTYLQRVLQNCPWPMSCPGNSYRTVVRPTYKVMYKMVTAREWRCCPGHSGPSCEEGGLHMLSGPDCIHPHGLAEPKERKIWGPPDLCSKNGHKEDGRAQSQPENQA